MCALSDDAAKSPLVLEPDVETDKRDEPSGATHPMPTLRLVAPQARCMVLRLPPHVEYLRHRRSLPRVPSPMDFDSVPFLQAVVAAFGLVCGVSIVAAIFSNTVREDVGHGL